MAIDKSDFTKRFIVPTEKIEVTRLAETMGKSKKFRENGRNFLFKAGIDVERKDAPVFYELGEGGIGMKPATAEFGSEQFWDLLQKGRIMSYPVGEKDPVQVQCEGGTWQLSRPVTEMPLPAPPQPKKMSGWQRFMNTITFGLAYRAEKEQEIRNQAAYDKQVADQRRLSEDMDKIGRERTDDKLKSELESYDKKLEEQTRAVEQEKIEKERAALTAQVERVTGKEPHFDVDEYRLRYQELAGPKPVIRKEWIGQGTDKFYTQEEADSLQTYELPQDKGLGGTVITDQEFAALSVLACSSDELGGEFRHDDMPSLSIEENKAMNFSMWGETMVYYKDTPRPGNGRVLPELYQPARAKVSEAIAAYHDRGDPSQLGHIIAEGSKFFLHTGSEPVENSRFLATMSLMGECAALVDRDPALKAAVLDAKDKEGNPLIAEEDLDTGRGVLKAADLNRRNEKAKVMLQADAAGLARLSPEERKQYIKDRTEFALANKLAKYDIEAQKKGKEYKDKSDAMGKKINDLSNKMGEYARDPNKQKEFAQAMKDLDDYQGMLSKFDDLNLHVAQVFTALGAEGEKGMETLMQTHLPNAEKLYELSSKDAEAALEPGKLFGDTSPYAQAPAEPQKAPQTKEQVLEGPKAPKL